MEWNYGDLVLMKAKGTGNGLPGTLDAVEVILMKIDESKKPTGLRSSESNVMVLYKGKYTKSHTDLIIKMIKKNEPLYEVY